MGAGTALMDQLNVVLERWGLSLEDAHSDVIGELEGPPEDLGNNLWICVDVVLPAGTSVPLGVHREEVFCPQVSEKGPEELFNSHGGKVSLGGGLSEGLPCGQAGLWLPRSLRSLGSIPPFFPPGTTSRPFWFRHRSVWCLRWPREDRSAGSPSRS